MKTIGKTTVAIGLVISIGSVVISGMVSYYTTQITNAKDIGQDKAQLMKEISSDRERISVVEADTKTFKEWLTRVEGKLDTVIREK